MDQNKIPTIDLGLDDRAAGATPYTKGIEPSKSLPHGDLLKVLYFIFDTFKPFGIQFFPVRETAKAMLAGDQLEGDQIDIGIRKLEWTENQKFYVMTNFDNEKVEMIEEDLDHAVFNKDGVKIVFHFYDDNPCIQFLSSVNYEYEDWQVPQRFEEFCEKYDK